MRSIRFHSFRERQSRDNRRFPENNSYCKTSMTICANKLTIEYRQMMIAMTSIDGASNCINWPQFLTSVFSLETTEKNSSLANVHHVCMRRSANRRIESEVTIALLCSLAHCHCLRYSRRFIFERAGLTQTCTVRCTLTL